MVWQVGGVRGHCRQHEWHWDILLYLVGSVELGLVAERVKQPVQGERLAELVEDLCVANLISHFHVVGRHCLRCGGGVYGGRGGEVGDFACIPIAQD